MGIQLSTSCKQWENTNLKIISQSSKASLKHCFGKEKNLHFRKSYPHAYLSSPSPTNLMACQVGDNLDKTSLVLWEKVLYKAWKTRCGPNLLKRKLMSGREVGFLPHNPAGPEGLLCRDFAFWEEAICGFRIRASFAKWGAFVYVVIRVCTLLQGRNLASPAPAAGLGTIYLLHELFPSSLHFPPVQKQSAKIKGTLDQVWMMINFILEKLEK